MKILSTFLLTLSTLLFANEGESLFNAKCRVCHGNLADRPAYNASSIIAGWSVEKTIHALQGYKSSHYGGRFKSTMEGIAKELSSEEMILLAQHIYKLEAK
jgi:cytochrome c553